MDAKPAFSHTASSAERNLFGRIGWWDRSFRERRGVGLPRCSPQAVQVKEVKESDHPDLFQAVKVATAA